MRTTRARIALAAAALISACATRATTVPVTGSSIDIARLAGRWSGEYWSAGSGRSGSIQFDLEAGADTAHGTVLMIPSDRLHEHAGTGHPATELIGISFVGVRRGRVEGRLEPYNDPDCGCTLQTRFEGMMRADTITGTFTSLHVEGGALVNGNWRVARLNAGR